VVGSFVRFLKAGV